MLVSPDSQNIIISKFWQNNDAFPTSEGNWVRFPKFLDDDASEEALAIEQLKSFI